MNPVVTGANGVVVITQVIPPNGQHVIQAGPNILQNTLCQVPETLRKFFKGEPKALGVTQILIGLMQFILGVILVSATPTLSSIFAIIGLPFWGGVLFIISGSLSVAAKNKANMCLVKGSMVMNILSSIAAFIGIIFLSVDLSFTYYSYYSCNYNFYDGHHSGSYYNEYDCQRLKDALMRAIHGIQGVLLLLMLLEFFISISTSAFGCKAVCCSSNSNMQSVVILQNECKPEMNFNPVAPPMYNVNDQYRPEARFPSMPAPAYTENSQYRPEANFSAMTAPLYNNIDPCRPHIDPPSLVPLIVSNNEQNKMS
ncbi:membrane-spanning 4-domains subfamily A member 15-like [Microcaecilia unicolor]|uniref:Membrane-spanning 4-domains subfamily A member 15-like n=1 Tax=Microcaecilia unicolor TaxID=1415580 RepID=A0A6P7X0X7_9AMPH|nr:membrane-spanning 4-domains subfamily A member 15-like [Microcaecilia unicolor]XP_030046140.1 membrane-spanning 4-domains subfamily A member 15-like [Microcaecilia unicolor]XP_030046141.1 membrane-spanning 4-domains subfamily A member 15-like [Microcaecilia unicolor]